MFVEILQPATQQTIFGSLCQLCAPSEGVGCLMVLLAEADLTLNILLVIVVNLAALGLSSPQYYIGLNAKLRRQRSSTNKPLC